MDILTQDAPEETAGKYFDDISVYLPPNGVPRARLSYGRRLSQEETQQIISILQEYSKIAPTEQESFHEIGVTCYDPDCAPCKRRLREAKAWHVFPPNNRPTRVEPGVVYLVSANDKHKIGATGNIEKRLKGLRRECGSEPSLIHSIRTKNKFALETYWLRHFIDYHLRGEWFSLPSEAIEEFCEYSEMEAPQ